MKRCLLLLVMAVSLAAHGQNVRGDFSLTTATGQAVSGASVYVLSQPASTTTFTPTINLFGSLTGSGSATCGSSGGQINNPLTTDQFGHACAYFSPGTYTVCYVSPLVGQQCYLDQSYSSGSGGVPPQISPEELGTYYYVDGFPTSCTIGGTSYTTQLDCAWYTALATLATAITNPTVVVGTNTYTTCAGLQMIPTGYTGANSVNLVSMSAQMNDGFFGFPTPAAIRQSCSISTGTLYLPFNSSGAFKHLTVDGISIDANKLAPYAVQILGANANSVFKQIQVSNGTTGPAIFGVQFQNRGTTQSIDMEDWNVFDTTCSNSSYICGSGAAVSVSLSGGVPSFTVTAGGSGYDSNTLAQLVGFQSGTNNQPCSSMGTTTATVVGGAITGITSSATGCTGNVYVALSDAGASAYGLELDNVTDSNKISGINIYTGRIAGLYAKGVGTSAFYGVHAWGQSFYGILNASSSGNFVGTDCGETSIACFDNTGNAVTTVIGGIYFSSIQWQGFSLMRNEGGSSRFKASSLYCQDKQTAEFHTLANPSGTVDTSQQNSGADALEDVEYCGSGSGSTINATPSTRASRGTVTDNQTTFFTVGTPVFQSCMAQSNSGAPTVSGTVITFPGDGAHNGGVVTCSSANANITTQAVSSTGGTAQTFDLSSQFGTSGTNWLQFDAGIPQINVNGDMVVQNGNLHAIGGANITATTTNGTNTVFRCLTAGSGASALPVGALTITAADCGTSVSTGFPVN